MRSRDESILEESQKLRNESQKTIKRSRILIEDVQTLTDESKEKIRDSKRILEKSERKEMDS